MPHRTLKKWCRLAERDWPLGTSMAQMRVEVWVWTQEERWNCNKHMLKPCEVNTEDASETEQSQLLIRKMKWWWHPLQTREKVSWQPLLMKDLSPELTSNTHYRTLKWLQCLYFCVYIKDQGAATASKCISKIGSGWMCLCRGACGWQRWAVRYRCMEHTSLNAGPWTQEESTERNPLLRWPGISDLIIWLGRL